MIKKVELTNFYSFGKTTIELHPETNILIGINGSGKSNFLKALRLLKEGVVGMGLKRYIFDFLGGFDNMFHKASESPNQEIERRITLDFTFDGDEIVKHWGGEVSPGDYIYRIYFIKSNSLLNYTVLESLRRTDGLEILKFSNSSFLSSQIKNGGPNEEDFYLPEDSDSRELLLRNLLAKSESFGINLINALRKNIRELLIYDYFDTTINSLIRRPILPSSEKLLSANGSNLTQLLNTIKINYKDSYRKIIEMLKEVNPNFEGFDFYLTGSNIELMLEERGFNSSIHVSNISDGTLRYLCLLAIVCNPNRGKLICIDEPELGLHPDMILNLANAIKDASANSTFVILTHSESLLNYFEIENLRVFEKDEQNGTTVKSFSTDQFAEWYEDYTIGQMWKQGDFGGVRYGN